jgi:hypothetical protein
VTAGVRIISRPEPGYFKLRFARGGAWVPARIWKINHEPGVPDNILDTGPILMATIGTREVDPHEVWERGQRIDQREYDHRLALADWTAHYAPHEPEANPKRRVDLSHASSLF